MYPALQPTLLTTETFHLERNRRSIGATRILYTLGIFVFPTLFANALFYTVFGLNGFSLLLAMGTTGLILLNLTLYLLNLKEQRDRTLIIGFNEIKVLEKSTILHTIPFEEMTISSLTWGGEEATQPAIRISGKGFPCMTIGCRVPTTLNGILKATPLPKTIDCTAYLISDETEWQHLLQALDNLIEV